jgi:hypothetical protein
VVLNVEYRSTTNDAVESNVEPTAGALVGSSRIGVVAEMIALVIWPVPMTVADAPIARTVSSISMRHVRFVCDATSVPDAPGANTSVEPNRTVGVHVPGVAPVVMRLDRFSGQPPSLIFEDIKSEFHRIKDPNALAYIRAIQHDAAKMAKMRTIPGLVGLLEHGERKAAQKFAADHTPKPPATEPVPTTST